MPLSKFTIASLVIVIALALTALTLYIHSTPNTKSSVSAESYLLNSLTYPSNAAAPYLSNCVLVANLMKPKKPTKVWTAVITMVRNSTVIKTTRTVRTPPNVSGKVYGTSVRLIPIKEYQCGQYHLVLISDLGPANVSKILLTIDEYRSPTRKEVVSNFIEEGGKFFVKLINGSKVELKKVLSYSVSVEEGGYLILKQSRGSVVRVGLVINYRDGYVRQYGIDFIGVELSNACLDSNCSVNVITRN